MNPFKGIDIQSALIDDLALRLTPIFDGLSIDARIIPIGTKLFRARIVSGLVQHISEVGVPAARFLHKLGRLNEISESVGYFSNSWRTTYFEVQPKIGDFIVLSRWITKEEMIFLHVGYTHEVFSSLGSSRNANSEAVNVFGGNRERKIYDYLSRELCELVPQGEEWRYKKTIAIGRKFLGEGPHDGLLYPSIAMYGNSDNFAIKIKSLPKIQIKSIEYNQVVGINNNKINVRNIDSSSEWSAIGDITWSGRPLHWSIVAPSESIKAHVEDDEWVIYDEWGNEIEPN